MRLPSEGYAQVRTGPGAQPPRRGGTVVGTQDAIAAEVTQIIDDLRGEVGARKRRNFDNVRAKFLNELGEGGAVHQALEDIVMLAASSTKVRIVPSALDIRY